MIDERIQRTESTVQSAADIPEERKAAVLGLLGKLKARINTLSETHEEEARSIAHLVETSADEATQANRKRPAALNGLKDSVQKFESSHPELVEVVNEFATALANMGL